MDRSLLKELMDRSLLKLQRVDMGLHIGQIEVYSKSGQGSTHWMDRSLLKLQRVDMGLHIGRIEVYSKSGQGSTHWMDRSLLKEWTGVYTLDG